MPLFVLRRLLSFVLTLLATSAVVFAVLELLPGNAAQVILGETATPESIAALEARLGLDRPAVVRYTAWDDENPATLSTTVIRDVIRGRIGFDGLLMSDDLGMKEPRFGCGMAQCGACTVLIDGAPLAGDTDPKKQRIGLVPQRPYLFSGTVRSNLLFGRPDATDDAVRAAAKAALPLGRP